MIKRKCKLCPYRKKPVKFLGQHLKIKHNMNIVEYYVLFPNEKIKQTRKKKRAGKVKCKICNKYFRSITNSHLAKHGITVDEYREGFPGAKIVSKTTNEMRSLNNEALKREIVSYITPSKKEEKWLELHNSD